MTYTHALTTIDLAKRDLLQVPFGCAGATDTPEYQMAVVEAMHISQLGAVVFHKALERLGAPAVVGEI